MFCNISAGEGGKHTATYRINRLVHQEVFQHVETAILRETEIKKWRREKKIAVIEKNNPIWEDLAEDWGKRVPMTFRPVSQAINNSSTLSFRAVECQRDGSE